MLDYIAMFICGGMFMFCLLMLLVILPMFRDDEDYITEDNLEEMYQKYMKGVSDINITIDSKRNRYEPEYYTIFDALYEDVKGDTKK